MMNLMTKSFASIAVKSTRKVVLTTVLATTALFTSAIAQAATETIPVDLAGANTTKHEIAVLQVLSEVCPPMLGPKKTASFRRSYNAELRKMLPASIDNPAAAIQYLSTQQDYKSVLTSMRNWTMGFSHDENLALCNDLANAKL